MSDSILNDVKQSLQLLPNQNQFDVDIMMHVNTALNTLTQLGVGPIEGYQITGSENRWSEFADDKRVNSVRSYIFLRVKLMFDPPGTSFVIASMERQIQELEYRINVVVEYG